MYLKKIIKNKKIIFFDIKCISYLPVWRNNLNYIHSKPSLLLNCGYGKGYSVLDIVNLFKKMNKNIIIKYAKRRPGDVAQVYADTKKSIKLLKWRPKHNNLKLILKSAFKWEKKIKKS